MAHFLAVDWDSVELRAVLAASQRGSIKILKAESAPLEFSRGTDESLQPDIALTLKNLIKREKIPRARLLLGLNRASVDMMTFTLPKSKSEDLPDLVKNQALRDSPGFSETSPIDFISGPASDGDNIRAIAATVSRLQLKTFRNIGQSVGMRAKRIEFRPLALAELYLRSNQVTNEPILLVQCTTDEVDMVVVEESNIVFVRSIKLPESLEDEERIRRVTAEIMRTIAVSRQEIEGSALEKAIVFGTTDAYQPLQEQLREQEIETVIQNPFLLPCVQTSAKAKSAGATNTPGHYAALLGMVLSEQAKSPTRIDFLHPREKPQPLNIARFVALFLLFVGVIGYASYHVNRQYLKGLENQLTELNIDIETLQTEYRQSWSTYAQLSQANLWESQQLIWLDELRDISLRLPDEQDIVISQMQYGYVLPTQNNRGNYGYVDLSGRARNANVLHEIVRSFNDNFHRAQIIRQVPSQSGGGYTIGFSLRIMTWRQPYAAFWQRLSPELRQLSNVPPDFPKDEPPQSDTQRNTSPPNETVTTSRQTQQTDEQMPQEKQKLAHTFPPQYSPKSQPEQQPQSSEKETEFVSATTQPKTTKPLQQHVLPIGYAPLSTGESEKASPDRIPQRHLYPGKYLPTDALSNPVDDAKNTTEAKEGDA